MKIIVGVLALQGDFKEHVELLCSHNIDSVQVRTKKDLEKCSALIIPGGESTTISKLMQSSGLDKEIKKRVLRGMPFYGTCAGAILACRKILGEKTFKPLGLINVEMERNAYGRQVDSFEALLQIKNFGVVNGIFIRSPVITKIGKGIEVLSELNGLPVLVKSRNVLIGSFHPETEKNFFAHKLLLEMLETKKALHKT